MKRKLRSPIHWFGGKGQIVGWLLNFVPPHKYYLEVFGGGASLFFAKSPAPFEVYNDLDEGLFSFFKVLRNPNKFRRFYRRVRLTPYSRKEYYYARNKWRTCEDEIEKARMWYVVVRMSFGGDFENGSWGYALNCIRRNMPKVCSEWLSILDMLPAIERRVSRVQIENLDWKRCLEKYDWGYDEEFVYLDPPYLQSARRAGKYSHEMTDDDHKELVEYLLTHKRKVMLSGYDNEIYRELEFHGFQKYCKEVACRAVGRTRQSGLLGKGATFKNNKAQRRTECIWINYELPKSGNLF